MATPPVFRSEIKEAQSLFVRLWGVVTWTSAVLLLTSLPRVFVEAQEVPEPTASQKTETYPVSPSEAMKKASRKAKNASKYDVDRIGQRGIGEGINLYSLEDERELGRELYFPKRWR